jgi:hypothetical protein
LRRRYAIRISISIQRIPGANRIFHLRFGAQTVRGCIASSLKENESVLEASVDL